MIDMMEKMARIIAFKEKCLQAKEIKKELQKVDVIAKAENFVNNHIQAVQEKALKFKDKNGSNELLNWQKEILNKELECVNVIQLLFNHIAELRADILLLDVTGVELKLAKNPKYQKYINKPNDYRDTILEHLTYCVKDYRENILPIKEERPNHNSSDIKFRVAMSVHTTLFLSMVISEIDKYDQIKNQ